MSSSSVWVQLFYEDERKGSPEQIYKSDLREGRDWNVSSLRILVKDKLKKELDHAGLTEIFVFSPNIAPPFSQDKALNSWDQIPSNSSGPQPLILVAPAPPQPPPQPADLNQQASQKFELTAAKLSLCFIPDGKNIDSRKKNNYKEDRDLEDFMQLGGNPVVLAWEQGSDGSPKKRTPCGTVEAAHIIPVASPLDVRHRAGLRGLYDTRNGMLLESRLHIAFDSFVWCMNEEGKFCLFDAESDAENIRKYGLSKWEGKTLNLGIGIDPDAPTKATLKARYDLFLAKVKEKKQKEFEKSKASLTKKN
ncbi:HNH endonuclease [Nitzschia inconspicua]|uniref:HNH endonuclease n=1 Tax=Nitzschia inconspicua TaxID=303405 RepID=A0A9K3PRG4_9STRA|nr:HNH endonuclease [Nitzschia inconspicua]